MADLSSIQRFFNARGTLTQFRTLAAVADAGQLKKAAAILHVSAPAVSKQLSELEAALGEKILIRRGARLEFTQAGLLLLGCARQLLAQLDRTKSEMLQIHSGAGGTIAIGAVPSVAPVMLPNLVLELRKVAPNGSIQLVESRFDGLAKALDSSSLDVAIARYTGHYLSANFVEEKLFSDPLVVVVGSQHSVAKGRTASWKDLSGVPWILPPAGSELFTRITELLSSHQLPLPPGCVESASLSVNASLLQRYPFLAIMPLRYARPFVEADVIRTLPLRTGAARDEIKAVWRKDNQNPGVQLSLACIRKVVELIYPPMPAAVRRASQRGKFPAPRGRAGP